MSKETPCVAVCMIDPKTKLCFGCGRTLPEIARWHAMESAERLSVMALLPARMAEGAVMALTAVLVLFYVVWPGPLVDAAAAAAKSLY